MLDRVLEDFRKNIYRSIWSVDSLDNFKVEMKRKGCFTYIVEDSVLDLQYKIISIRTSVLL